MLYLLENRTTDEPPDLPVQSSGGCETCAIRSSNLCRTISRIDAGQAAAPRHRLAVEAHQILFSQDEEVDAVFIVTEGVLRLSRLFPDARRHVTGFALTGDLLGLMSANGFGQTAEALTPVTVCRFERAAFLGAAARNSFLFRALQAQISRELTMAQQQAMLLGRGTAEEKVAGFLIGIRQRYAQIGQLSTTLELPMKRQDIADHLGLTMETVCRMLTRFEREKIILLVPGGVRVLARARLERLALI